MRAIDRAIRVGIGAVILLAWLALGVTTAPSAQAASVDLGAVVLSKIDGYQPAPPGVALDGPLTKEQLSELDFDPDDVEEFTDSGIPTFARTFVTEAARIALIIAIDGRSVRGARDIERGAKIGSREMEPRIPVAGVDHGFRVVATPEQASGAHAQQVFFRSGQIAFFVTVAEMELTPVTETEVLRLTFAQQAAVPAEIAAAPDDLAYELGYQFGRLLVYGVAGLFQAAVVVLLLVVLVRRKSPAPAPATWSPPPPPPAWSPSPAPWGPPPASPPPPAWPAPQQRWG